MFRMSRRLREMYIGHARLSVCPSPHAHTITARTRLLGKWQGCPSVVHYWTDLQSMHRFRCCDNIARTQNVSECLYSVYAWWLTVIEAKLTNVLWLIFGDEQRRTDVIMETLNCIFLVV